MVAAEAESTVQVVHARTPARRVSYLELVPSRLVAKDAQDLRWFLDNPPIAQVSASSFGASLARAGLYGYGSMPCLRCGGDRKRGRPGTGFSPRSGKPYRKELERYRRAYLAALGFRLVQDTAKARRTQELMQVLDVAGEVRQVVTREQVQDLVPELPLELCLPCNPCGSRGIVPKLTHTRRPITARPTCEVSNSTEPSAAVDGAALIRWCRVERRLAKAQSLDPGCRIVLETYYGPGGGDLTCLWLLTPGGRIVAEQAANPQSLPLEILLHNERQRKDLGEAERAKHGRATRESGALFDRACRAWNVAGMREGA